MWNGGAFPHGGFLDGILPIAGATSAEYIPLSPPYHEEGTFYYYCEVTNKIKDNGDGGSKEAKSTYQNHRQYQPMVKVKVIQPAAMPVLELFTQAVGKVTGNTTGSGTVKDPVEAPTYIYDPWLITAPAMDWDVLKPALQEGLRRGKGLDADHEYYFLDLRAVTGITEWYLDILDEKYVGMGMEKVAGIYLPDSVTSMGGSALAGYRCLSEIHGANVETLQNNALNDKHYLEEAEQIDFPNLKTMGFSFMNCVNLRSVYFPEAEVISTLNQGSAFEGCTSLVTVNLPKAKTIGLFAFGRCGNLQTVCIPLAEQIGGKAFGQCPALSDIYMGDVPTLAGDWINPPGRLFALKNNAPGTITIHVPAGKVGDYTSVWEVDASTPQNGNRAVYADASFNLPYHKAVNIVGDQ
ncbi:MAG: leucine-rich repeat domain-containing protein [Spirochaetaceae bacterium]|jgi:hypothetical protein|nr:leucine-rich repeat domain-containing protein [Spirochaetaceae bacterium]